MAHAREPFADAPLAKQTEHFFLNQPGQQDLIEQLKHDIGGNAAVFDVQFGNLRRGHCHKSNCPFVRLAVAVGRILPMEMNSATSGPSPDPNAAPTAMVRLSPKASRDQEAIAAALRDQGFDCEQFVVLKRSLDARRSPAVAELIIGLGATEVQHVKGEWQNVAQAQPVVIVGAGPAGLYCALRLIELGLKPIVLERGKEVRERRRDLVQLIRQGKVDPDSNYCFGEGGAGTYSDGKLYTRAKKRGSWRKVLGWLVEHGADRDILVETHPHIGTNKLPAIISDMRERIKSCGGEVRFKCKVVGVERDGDGAVKGVHTSEGTVRGEAVVVATGHGARDVFEWMHDSGLKVERKPFALGVRIEHPQSWVNGRQYKLRGGTAADELGLPPAAYALVTQTEGGGVFSFCMCPGGVIAPCATEDGEVVTNGWSPSKRNNPWANSGIVTTVSEEDLDAQGHTGALGALDFQRAVERACSQAAGGHQRAPAQRLADFVARRPSRDLPPCSYLSGLTSVDLTALLPPFVVERLIAGIRDFDRKMPGYIHPDAVVVAPESRTSSPVRMPRDRTTLEMEGASGLFPCGEGAGYAGGIASAAMDGIRVAEAISARGTVNPG